jgi:hypothetical protein
VAVSLKTISFNKIVVTKFSGGRRVNREWLEGESDEMFLPVKQEQGILHEPDAGYTSLHYPTREELLAIRNSVQYKYYEQKVKDMSDMDLKIEILMRLDKLEGKK